MKRDNGVVPNWSKKVVWYQIFPERFRNGDTKNDPSLEDIKGAWPHDDSSLWEVHPWTSDWYKLQPYEKKNGKDFWYNVQRRRYGGDLHGIFDKLNYLEDLGITAVYLNPVFAAPSSHKYDTICYHHIDPNFGPDPPGDIKIMKGEAFSESDTWKWTSADLMMLRLIKDMHSRGIRIIFDGVFNHVGIRNFAFKDVLKNQSGSAYNNWFKILSWENNENKSAFEYKCWAGFKELPEWNQDENGLTEGPKKYIFEITRRWMDPDLNGNPQNGIDGWRLDVAYCIAHKFWKDWRKYVKSINSEAYITAEIIDSAKALKPYLQGDEFDAVMNYNFSFACAEYFINKKNKIPVTEFELKLKKLRNAFPEGVTLSMQNLYDSHDSNRLASHIVNRDLSSFREWANYFKLSKGNNHSYKLRKPTRSEIKLQMLMAIFQMTYIGAPMIYYGDEAGMWGANDPDCRKPMIWDDLKYENEVFLPNQKMRKKPDKVEFNSELFAHYKKLIRIRNRYQALQTGKFTTIIKDDKNNLFGFKRNENNMEVLVILNSGKKNKKISVGLKKSAVYFDVLNEKEYECPLKKLELVLTRMWGCILVKEKTN